MDSQDELIPQSHQSEQTPLLTPEQQEQYQSDVAYVRANADTFTQICSARQYVADNAVVEREVVARIQRIHDSRAYLQDARNWKGFLQAMFPSIAVSTSYALIGYAVEVAEMSNALDTSESHLIPRSVREARELRQVTDGPQAKAEVMRAADASAAAQHRPRNAKDVRTARQHHTIKSASDVHVSMPLEEYAHIASQDLPSRDRHDIEDVRKDQAHICAAKCKQAAAQYCKAMDYEQEFAHEVYDRVLSMARNMEAEKGTWHDETTLSAKDKAKVWLGVQNYRK